MIYEYYCLNIDCKDYKKIFKEKQSVNDEPLKKCIKCKLQTLQRVIYPSNFVLKGIGIYKNGTN